MQLKALFHACLFEAIIVLHNSTQSSLLLIEVSIGFIDNGLPRGRKSVPGLLNLDMTCKMK